MSSFDKSIGGYFELELPSKNNFLYPDAKCYQSARAAFLALLRSVKPKRIWMPHYICDSMLAPVHAAGVELCHYAIDENFVIAQPINLHKQDILLYVNYFGICDQQVEQVLKKFNPSQVVIDCSQAFYAKPKECLATIYSPRKFFGLPDGGLLLTEQPIPLPQDQDQGSEKRMEHLIRRLASVPEAGYAAFQKAEESLSDMEPHNMSQLTKKLLESVDVATVKIARNRNFQYLRNALDQSNKINFSDFIDGPLCYPYFIEKTIAKEIFVKERVFIATYWPDVLSRVDENSAEAKIVTQCIPIPCDQRYDENVLDRILKLI